jgi:hypothetical protein
MELPENIKSTGVQIRWIDGTTKGTEDVIDCTDRIAMVLAEHIFDRNEVQKYSFYFSDTTQSIENIVVQYRMNGGWNNLNNVDNVLFETLKTQCLLLMGSLV